MAIYDNLSAVATSWMEPGNPDNSENSHESFPSDALFSQIRLQHACTVRRK